MVDANRYGVGGFVEDRFLPVLRRFADNVRSGREIGAGLCVHLDGKPVVDLWGGWADREAKRPWNEDTAIVLFSTTKGIAAACLLVLADRGQLDYDANVADYWPDFAAGGKGRITVRTLLNHRSGLVGLSTPLRNSDFCDPEKRAEVRAALERQRPHWPPGERQGYHGISYGPYVDELFRQVAGESVGTFLRREIAGPLDADVWIGTPPEVDPRIAKLYPVGTAERLRKMVPQIVRGRTTEGRVGRAVLNKNSFTRIAFANPPMGPEGFREFNRPPMRRAQASWVNGVGSARGLARFYAPLALGGEAFGTRIVSEAAIAPIMARQSWADGLDSVLQKPLGWSQGFLKEETHLFSPNAESFGHSGMGGALGWADPIARLSIGYVPNRMDYRIRSKRCVEYCNLIYGCL